MVVRRRDEVGTDVLSASSAALSGVGGRRISSNNFSARHSLFLEPVYAAQWSWLRGREVRNTSYLSRIAVTNIYMQVLCYTLGIGMEI